MTERCVVRKTSRTAIRGFVVALSIAVVVVTSADAQPTTVPGTAKSKGRSDVASDGSVRPDEGFVPDEQTALAVAHVVLTRLYGADVVRSEEPFRVTSDGIVWNIEGKARLPTETGDPISIRILKSTGAILRVYAGE